MNIVCRSIAYALAASWHLGFEIKADPGNTGTDFFESRIRPLLLEECGRCHGPKKQEGNLRLDGSLGWQKGGDSGPAIQPGNPAGSLLLRAVRGEEKDLQMPPKKRLTTGQIADLEKWIAEGAHAPRSAAPPAFDARDMETGRNWWSFKPVKCPPFPGADARSESENPVDQFIDARLHEAGLAPSRPADKRTLIRRVSYGLTGLPPSFEETQNFISDSSAHAFERVVERLLSSPHYGEHGARRWLDLARYSDTKGYVYGREDKTQIHSWVYRDWVTHSLNEDLPYNQFLKLQIAGDLLEKPNSPHLAAMGFLTLGRRFLGVTHDIIDDRIDVLMRTTQGLSVGCARCHDHKFDPIPTADYYALYGVFQSSAEKIVPCGYDFSAFPEFETERIAKQTALDDALLTARNERAGQLRRSVKEYLLAQLELEKYPEETFTQILGAGDMHPLNVRQWQKYLERTRSGKHAVFWPWHQFAALDPRDFESKAPAVSDVIAALAPGTLHPEISGAFRSPPKTMREVAERYGAVFATAESRVAQALKDDPAKSPPDDAVSRVLYGQESPCRVPDEELVNIEWFFPTALVVQLWKKQAEMEKHIAKAKELVPFAKILVDRPEASTPRVFKRGNPLLKGEEVPRRFLQVLSDSDATPFSDGSGRLELAQRIGSEKNPLTARVMVNRIWQQHFGRGLVATPSDFGRRADGPSHPELLDYLAYRFMQDGWSIKGVHRLILLSKAYQRGMPGSEQADTVRRAAEIDPGNSLLWRANTRRLRFEEMRDAWLVASGELNRALGGKSADLFQPSNVRRSLYGFIDREAVPSALRTFDFASPDLSIPERTETIVPQQALFLLNHPYPVTRVRALVRRISSQNDESERIHEMYRLIFQRNPSAEELEAARSLLKNRTDASPPGAGNSPGKWEELAHMLMVSNEFLFLD